MKLKVVYPDMEKLFGKLTFAGNGEETARRVNGRPVVQQREYHLYSTEQRAEDVVVRIPGKVGAKGFEYEAEVKLVNPTLIAEGRNINGRGYTNYVLLADDMVKM